MSEYTCGRCRRGPTGMMGHYGKVCHVTARIEGRQGVAALLDNPFHFCCPGDCELFEADGTPRPPREELVEPDDDLGTDVAEWLAGLSEALDVNPTAGDATDSHCHVVRDGDTIPCTERPGEPHRDEQGDTYATVPLNSKEANGGR